MASDPLIESLRSVLLGLSDPTSVLRTLLDSAARQTGADRGVFVEIGADGALDYRVLHRMEPEQLAGPAGEYSRRCGAIAIPGIHKKKTPADFSGRFHSE